MIRRRSKRRTQHHSGNINSIDSNKMPRSNPKEKPPTGEEEEWVDEEEDQGMAEITMDALKDMQKKQINENKKLQAQQKKQLDLLTKMCGAIDNLTARLDRVAFQPQPQADQAAQGAMAAMDPTAAGAANILHQGPPAPGEYVGIGARNKTTPQSQTDVPMMNGVPNNTVQDVSRNAHDLAQVQNSVLLAQQVPQSGQMGSNGHQQQQHLQQASVNTQPPQQNMAHNFVQQGSANVQGSVNVPQQSMAQNNMGYQQQYMQQQYPYQQQQQQQLPAQNINSVDLDAFMNHYMNSTQQQIPQNQGNVQNIFQQMFPSFSDNNNDSSQASCHPYMFIQREGVKENDYNKKFQLRESMDFTEYIKAYMNMLTCKSPPFPIIGHVRFHLEHIEQLAEDNRIKRWEVVRKWSQYMFDNVEKGSITWENELKVQLTRQRVQEAAERSTTSSVNTSSICKMYNAMPNGCSAEEEDKNCKEHMVGTMVMKHICSYCNRTLGKSFNHPEWKCRNKRNNSNRSNFNNDRQQNFNQNERQNTYQNPHQQRQQYVQQQQFMQPANYQTYNTYEHQPSYSAFPQWQQPQPQYYQQNNQHQFQRKNQPTQSNNPQPKN